MPTPSSSPAPLSEDQVVALRAELDQGRQPMVWFTPAAVGVDAGRSAKVVAVGEPAEGDFIQVRPTGSHDEVSFATTELTMDRPPRRKRSAEPAGPAAGPAEPEVAEPEPAMDELLVIRERPARRPRQQRPARPKPPAPVTVTLSSTPEGEWSVEVLTGGRRVVRPRSIAPAAVASAARALGGAIAAAIDGALSAARDQQRARVAQLEADLAAARDALAELSE